MDDSPSRWLDRDFRDFINYWLDYWIGVKEYCEPGYHHYLRHKNCAHRAESRSRFARTLIEKGKAETDLDLHKEQMHSARAHYLGYRRSKHEIRSYLDYAESEWQKHLRQTSAQ